VPRDASAVNLSPLARHELQPEGPVTGFPVSFPASHSVAGPAALALAFRLHHRLNSHHACIVS